MAKTNREICAEALRLALFATSTEFWKEVKASGLTPEDVFTRRQNPRQQNLGVDILKTLKLIGKEVMESLFLLSGYGGKGMCHPVEGCGPDEQGERGVTHLHFYTEDMGQAIRWAERMVKDGCWPKTAVSYSIETIEEFYSPDCPICGKTTSPYVDEEACTCGSSQDHPDQGCLPFDWEDDTPYGGITL